MTLCRIMPCKGDIVVTIHQKKKKEKMLWIGIVNITHEISIRIMLAILIMAVDGSSPDFNLSSKHLNYLVVHIPPFDYVFRGPNGTFSSYGCAQNVAIWLAAKLKYTYSFLLINETLIDKYGTHEAAFYQLINDKDIDGIATNFYLTLNRMQRMDYTTHYGWADGFRLVVPRLGEESRLFAFIGPFEPTVWLLVFITVFVVVIVMTLFAMIYRLQPWKASEVAENSTGTEIGTGHNMREPVKRNVLFNYLGEHTIYVVNIMTNQGSREGSSLYSFRILAGFWVLGAMVLVNSYTGIVISSLMTTKTKPSIDSFEDLAASTETEILLRHDTSIGEQILLATSGVFKTLGDQARRNPGNIVGDAFKVTEKLETGHYAFPFIQTFAVSFVSSQFKKSQQCRFKMSKQLPLSTGYYSWLFKKNSSYTNPHSRALADLWETGLPSFWVYKMFSPTVPRSEQCFVESTRRVSGRVPIQLSDLTSAFLILGIGTGLSVLCFLTELLYSRFLLCKFP
ncbi:probable glutamate receptor [Daphnia carinata]|uniref:probable glutamate receptor n=1 Tax=Daphnia carinata TaxID=120202 RepID=UPI00257A7CC0|nr:probable glutamate receptor [Daphnia carinata]